MGRDAGTLILGCFPAVPYAPSWKLVGYMAGNIDKKGLSVRDSPFHMEGKTMTYFAKTNTADPRTGFISIGEILTDVQADALGKDKLNELVERGVLGVSGGTEKPESKQTTPPDNTNDDKSKDNELADNEPEDNEAEEAECDLPPLDADDVIADEVPAKPATKRGGRKAK